MSPAPFEELRSYVTHDGENSSWVVQGVNLQNDCPYRNPHISDDFSCAWQLSKNRVICDS